MVKEALDMFMAGEAWEKARDIARNIAPRFGDTRIIVILVSLPSCTTRRRA